MRNYSVWHLPADRFFRCVPPATARLTRLGRARLVQQRLWLAVVWVALIATVGFAQSENSTLDEAFRLLKTLEPGENLQRFHPIEVAMAQAQKDQHIQADLESRLIAMLQSNSTDLAKDYVCRQLATCGSDVAVRPLAALLPNSRSSYMARYALEGIGGPVAARALREMLHQTAGPQRVGVVISLGRLADADAVPAIASLLAEDDLELRESAMIALGRIGNGAASQALRDFASHEPAELQPVLVDAMLAAGEALCRQGEHATAAGLFATMESADSERTRAAAFRGSLMAHPADRIAMMMDALRGKQSWKLAVAADYLVELTQPADIAIVTQAIVDLPSDAQREILTSLRQRSDPTVRAAALEMLKQDDVEVQKAALSALIASAQAEDMSLLVHTAATADEISVREAAFETLRLMNAPGTDQALLSLFDRETQHGPLLVRCALARRSSEFVPAFLLAAQSEDAATRREAFRALEMMATEQEAEALVALLSRTPPGEDRVAADRAVWMACEQIADPAARAAPLLEALEHSDAAAQCALLPTLARIGGEASLVAVHRAMQSAEPTVRDAGYRALANWPDDTVAAELLEVAKTNEVEAYRIWTLRAFARVVSLPSDRPPLETFAMLTRALELATRTEDKELIISRLAAVRVPEALALLLSFIDQPELRSAAVPAVFTLAKGLSQSHPDQARAALETIHPLTQDPATLQQIPKVLRDIEARQPNQNP